MVRGVVATIAGAALAATAALAASHPGASVSCGRIDDGAAVWAPSGRAVAFVRMRSYGAVSQVYRVGVDGRHLRLLSLPGDYAYEVAWSPDGTHVAYSTFDLGAVARVVVARADGTQRRIVATFQGERYPPPTFLAWAPDGRELAYVSTTVGLEAVRPDGGGQRVIARGATQPSWSRDGSRIAYAGDDGLTVAAASGADAHVVANGGSPAWSPKGERIAYVSRTGVGVHVVRADGTGDRLVDAHGAAPAWSPDATRLVDSAAGTDRERSALHIIDLQRRRVRTASHDGARFFGADAYNPTFAPKGSTILFSASSPTAGADELRFVQADGRRERRLTYHCVVPDESVGGRVYGSWLDDVVQARNGLRDTILCGRGDDLVFADRLDRAAHDCETVKRR
jgi:Tol biopolymer transport system component